MADRLVAPYIINPRFADDEIARPFLPVRLGLGGNEIQELAMIDSGADVCVLPHHAGVNLGALWEDQYEITGLSGLTEDLESRYITVNLTIGALPSILVPFVWTSRDDLPVILGQFGFFSIFDICFYRSQGEIALNPST